MRKSSLEERRAVENVWHSAITQSKGILKSSSLISLDFMFINMNKTSSSCPKTSRYPKASSSCPKSSYCTPKLVIAVLKPVLGTPKLVLAALKPVPASPQHSGLTALSQRFWLKLSQHCWRILWNTQAKEQLKTLFSPEEAPGNNWRKIQREIMSNVKFAISSWSPD